MTIETALYPNQLNATLPPQSDIVREGAGHLRLLKTVVKTTFPNLGGAWNATQTEANYIVGVTSPIQAQINSKGAIAGQVWTGTHSFPSTTTVGPLTPTIQGYLSTATSDVQAQINSKGAIAGQTWTGAHVFSGTATLPAATTIGAVTADELAHLSGVTSPIQTQFAAKASLNGATYTGAHNYTGATVTVQTLAPGASGNSAASVDYVNALAFAAALPAQTAQSGKFLTTNGVTASWSDTIDGNINIAGTARRITGDFSNATVANRTLIRTGTANGATDVTIVPNGTSNFAAVSVRTSESENASALALAVHAVAEISSQRAGSGAYLPLTFNAGGAERLRIDQTTGNVLATSGVLGYGIGAGGSAVQATSKSTAVALNKPSGYITMHAASLAAGATVTFVLNNSFIADIDTVAVSFFGSVVSVSTKYSLRVSTAGGFAEITLKNETTGALSEAVAFTFKVIKGSLF